MGSGWSGLVPCASQPCESNKRVYTGTTRTFTPFYFAREEHCKTWTAPRRSPDTTTTTRTSIHATDQLLVSTTPYYAHLYPLLPRARGALQDLDRTKQEPGHYDDYHDQGALSYAMCLPTAPGTWGTGTARGRGICPGSSRPRARVP